MCWEPCFPHTRMPIASRITCPPKMLLIAALSTFPLTRNSFWSSSTITPLLPFIAWLTTTLTTVLWYCTFHPTCTCTPIKRDVHHYVWVKNLSQLVSNKHQHAHHVCMSCLQVFTIRRILEQYEPNCLAHTPQQCIYPRSDKALLRLIHTTVNFHLISFWWQTLMSVFFDHPPTVDDELLKVDACPVGILCPSHCIELRPSGAFFVNFEVRDKFFV